MLHNGTGDEKRSLTGPELANSGLGLGESHLANVIFLPTCALLERLAPTSTSLLSAPESEGTNVTFQSTALLAPNVTSRPPFSVALAWFPPQCNYPFPCQLSVKFIGFQAQHSFSPSLSALRLGPAFSSRLTAVVASFALHSTAPPWSTSSPLWTKPSAPRRSIAARVSRLLKRLVTFDELEHSVAALAALVYDVLLSLDEEVPGFRVSADRHMLTFYEQVMLIWP